MPPTGAFYPEWLAQWDKIFRIDSAGDSKLRFTNQALPAKGFALG
jgi:hypothetical protein